MVFLELFIRLVGVFFNYTQKEASKATTTKSVAGRPLKRIIILGDSTAIMAGDETNRYLEAFNSYPKYLEHYLNSAQKKYYYKVENLSLMNGNTYRVLKDLDKKIGPNPPQLVVTMLGLIDGRLMPAIGQSSSKSYFHWWRHSRLYQLVELQLQEDRIKAAAYGEKSEGFSPFLVTESIKLIGEETNKDFSSPFFLTLLNEHIRINKLLLNSQFQSAADEFNSLHKKFGLGKLGQVRALMGMGKFEEAQSELVFLLEGPAKDNPYVFGALISLCAQKRDFSCAQAYKKLADKRAFKNDLPIKIAWALAVRVRGDLKSSNEILQQARNKIILDPNKKIYAFSVNKIKSDAQAASDFYDNIESSEYYKVIFDGLALAGEFEKLNSALNRFTEMHAWKGTAFYYLLENYVLFGQNEKSRLLLEHISKEMRDVSDYYRLVVYFSSMNKKLAPEIGQRLTVLFKNTTANFDYLYNYTKQRRIPLVLMQYPGFSTDITRLFLNRSDVFYFSNEHIFKDMPLESVYFGPKYPYVRNHYTQQGAQILAKHLGDYLLASKLLEK